MVDIFATRDSAQSYLPKSGYAAYSKGKVVAKLINARLKGKKPEKAHTHHREDNKRKEITAKRYEKWAKGLWRELLFG